MNNDNNIGRIGMDLPVLKIGRYTPRYPIIQGGMGIRISASSLAGAVARNGGVGTIASVALGFASPHFNGRNYFKANILALQDEIRKARASAPDGLVATNCMVAITDYDDMVRTSAESGAHIIISGAGLPMQLPELTKEHPEVALVPIVSSTKAARLILKRWEKLHNRLPDAIVVEAPGTAGGHLGSTYEEVFNPDLRHEVVIPELVEFLENEAKVDIPVIAAGGIWTREDMMDVFAMGARGVQMATRFVCTHECDAPMAFKQTYLRSTKEDVTLVRSPVGLPGRALRNPFVVLADQGDVGDGRCISNCLKHCSYKTDKVKFCIYKALNDAQAGDVINGLVFCGSNAHRSTEIVSVKDIFEDLFPVPAGVLEEKAGVV